MKTRKNKVVNYLFCLFLGWSLQGNSMEKPITKEFKLSNGLRIVVREDHRAPVVVSQIWYKVGSKDEHRGITGVSHALEHMMFQGTPTLPHDGFAILISQYGGQNNAFTAEDYTAYYEELDAANLAISFQAEADRMQNLILAPEAFAKEIQVVIEERRMRTDDNPQNLTWERFMAVANLMGPYHHPIIGWQDDLDHMTVTDLRDWYQKWYAPNNATLIVVGDVQPEQVFQLAQKYFGNIPARVVPVIKSNKELTALGERRLKVEVPAKLPYMMWGFDVPTLKSASAETECYALMVMSALLSSGDSSRLNRELVRGQEVAADIGTGYDIFKQFPTQFMITAVPAEGVSVADLEKKVMAQIELLKTKPVTPQELQRVKTQLLAGEVFEKDSMSEQATLLGILETVGLGWQVADGFVDKIKAVTAMQIQAVAKKYLLEKHLTIAELVPEKVNKEKANP